MRILFDGTVTNRGGGVQVALDVLTQAVHTGVDDVFAVVSRALQTQVPLEVANQCAGFECIDLHPYELAYPLRLARIHSHERIFQPHVVFTVFGPPYWTPDAAKVSGFALPLMLYPEVAHTLDSGVCTKLRNYVGDVVRRHFLGSADFVIVETEAVRERLHSILGVAYDKICVAQNCCSSTFLKAAKSARGVKVLRGTDSHSILVPSSDYPHKNLRIIPEVARELVRGGMSRFIFTFTLQSDSREWARLQHGFKQFGLSEKVTTVGTLPHEKMADVYAASNAVLLPSLLECSTAVYPEAMAVGIPIVTSDRDFARVQCEDAALYFDPFNAVDVAHKLQLVLTDNDARLNLVTAANRVLEKNFSSAAERWHIIRECLVTASRE